MAKGPDLSERREAQASAPSSGGGSRGAGSGRASGAVLLRLESRASRLVVLGLTLLATAWLARVIADPAIAAWLAEGATGVEEVERALAWDPRNPQLHLSLGHSYLSQLEPDLERARAHLEAALRRRPTHAQTWFRLALLAERQGDAPGARRALETALRLDPHNVALRWEVALLGLRWGDRDTALQHLRYVLAVDPDRREAALHLGLAILPLGQSLLGLLPQDAEPLTHLFRAALRQRDTALAQTVWERRAPLAPALPLEIQRHYIELLLTQGEGTAARPVWLAVAPDSHPAPGNAVWNGGFESDRLLGWGFDWRVRRIWGVEVSLDHFVAAEGRQSLRLVFNSVPALDFAHVYQYVAVEPGREYQLKARAKALELGTASGLKLQLATADGETVLAETGAVLGTTADWVPLETRGQIPAGVSLVRLQLRREPASAPEANLAGKVWLDEVTLTPSRPAKNPSPPKGGEG